MITILQLKSIMPNAGSRAATYLPLLNQFMQKYAITGRMRECHFLAQIAQESGELRYTKELASGREYDTGRKAIALGNTPQADGDGQRFKGRGLIQITGRNNYTRISRSTGVDFVNNPQLLELPRWAVMSACWYWNEHGLNQLADKDALTAITRKINGGTNGLQERLKYLARAKKVIKE